MSGSSHSDYNSSDGESPESDNDGNRNRPQARTVLKNRRPVVVEEPFEFSEAWEKVKKLSVDMRNSKILRKNLKQPWKRIMPSLKKHAGETGFTFDELKILWAVITYPSSQVAEASKRELIMLLIPIFSIPGTFIQEMCLWAVESAHSGQRKRGIVTTVACILKYLYGLVEYSLIEGECFNNPFVYNMLFSLNGHKELIEWLFLILSKISTKDVIQLFHVRITSKLWKQPGPASQKRAIVNVLKMYKVMRPDYLPDNVFAIHIVSKVNNQSKLREDFRNLLLASKQRMLAFEGGDDFQNYDSTAAESDSTIFQKMFFHDTCLPFNEHDWKDFESKTVQKNSLVVWALLRPSRLGVFKINAEIMGVLQSWLEINFLHSERLRNTMAYLYFDFLEFTSYNKAQNSRYEFILDKCIEISEIVRHGLEVVDDWLLDFMSTWDMVLWRKKVLKLFSSLNIFKFSEFYIQILRKLEMDFLYSSVTESSEVWEALEQLLIQWILTARNAGEGAENQEDDQDLTNSVVDLYDFIFGLCTKYLAANLFDGITEPLIKHMINTFTKLTKLYKETGIPFMPVLPEALFYSVIVTDSADVFETFLRYLSVGKTVRNLLFRNDRDENILDNMVTNTNNFFNNEKKSCLSGLFVNELEMLDKTERRTLYTKLQKWSIKSSKALESFAIDLRQGGGGIETRYDLETMKHVTPCLFGFVSSSEVLKSGPTEMDSSNGNKTNGDATMFNPLYHSTPMPTQNKKK